MRQSSFFSSAQAHRFPLASKQRPLDRPHGLRKVDSLPSMPHLRMRSLGWSVKKTLPSASAAGPSVNWKSPASFSTLAPEATGLSAAWDAAHETSRTTKEMSRTRDMSGSQMDQALLLTYAQ